MYCNYKFAVPTQCSNLLCSCCGLRPKINPCREIDRIKTSTCIYLKMSFPLGPFNPVFFHIRVQAGGVRRIYFHHFTLAVTWF